MTDVVCQKCGERVPEGKLGMHNRTVHIDDALYLFNSPNVIEADNSGK